MTTPDLQVRTLSPEEWPDVRTTRLRALAVDPDKFLASFDDESARDEADWRETFETASWVAAFSASAPIGLLSSSEDPDDPTVRHVGSIWVQPDRRHDGVLRTMVNFLVQYEREAGVDELKLWVLDNNTEAQKIYPSVGFVPTGYSQPISDGRKEFLYVKTIRQEPGAGAGWE
jgi:GNAT superfamily N-acetyltransferase